MIMLLVIEGMRPRQWAKNIFVLAPLFFALRLSDGQSILGGVLATILFCMTSGAVYLVNDIVDREADRHHPEKRRRPIASGRLPVSVARFAAILLVGGAIALATWWRTQLALVIGAFFAMNLAYSFWLKRVPIFDVLLISSGFIMRVVGGALAISVPISWWILVCTFLLSLYLGLGKRLHELILLGDKGLQTRAALRGYRLGPTRILFSLTGGAAALSFALYALSPRAAENFGTRNLIFTLPFVIAGLWRFSRLTQEAGRAKSPTEALLGDWPIIVSAVLWGIAATAIIYLPRVL
jgi:4-hydroxybenzoate polyprenyltransferase